MKKAFFLSFSILVALATYSSAFEVDSLKYSKNADSISVSVIGKSALWKRNDLISKISFEIPTQVRYKGQIYPVTSIESNAFYQCFDLSSVLIPASITSIERDAFRSCSTLKKFLVAEDSKTFSSVDGILYSKDKRTILHNPNGNAKEYHIPEGVTTIANNAFESCWNLTSITIPESVTAIGDSAFESCRSLTSITIPKSVTTIGDYAFSGCSGMTSLTISEGVTSIGLMAFRYCNELNSVTIPKSVKRLGNLAFQNCRGLVSATIGSASIGFDAFNNCRALRNVILTEGVTSIAKDAFSSCVVLSSVTIPSSLTSINDAFSDCSSLSQFIAANKEQEYHVVDDVLFHKDTLSAYPPAKAGKEYRIPSGITSIGKYAFKSCYNLSSVEIPQGVTSIQDGAFRFCRNLYSIIIPRSVTSIGKFPFGECTGLTSMTILSGFFSNFTSITDNIYSGDAALAQFIVPDNHPTLSVVDGVLFSKDKKTLLAFPKAKAASYTIPNGVTMIGNKAFDNCVSLKSVTIPSSVTSIGDNAFSFSDNLRDIRCKAATPPSLSTISFEHLNQPAITLFVPQSAGTAYCSATGWSAFNVIEEGTNTSFDVTLKKAGTLIEMIGKDNLKKVSKLTIHGLINKTDIASIRTELPFLMDLNLKDATIVALSITDMGYTVPVNEIEEGLFKEMKSLESIVLPENIIKIGKSAFETCYYLREIKLPDSLTSIGEKAFNYTGLTSVTIPAGITQIEKEAFSNCRALTSVILPESITEIGSYGFNNCTKLAAVNFHSALTEIGYCAFERCFKLTSVMIPEGVTTIGASAFKSCSSLTSLVLPASLTYIGDEAFAECNGLTSMSFPEGFTEINGNPFKGCKAMTMLSIPASVNNIDYGALSGCNALTTYVVAPDSKDFAVIDGVLFSKDKKTLIAWPNGKAASYTVPDGVTMIEACAFEGCKDLTAITLPKSVTNIRPYTFSGCAGLASITLPENVKEIGFFAFTGCDGIKEMRVLSATAPIVGNKGFDKMDKASCVLHVPKGMKDAYTQAEEWKEFKKILAE